MVYLKVIKSCTIVAIIDYSEFPELKNDYFAMTMFIQNLKLPTFTNFEFTENYTITFYKQELTIKK
jgi:hypothetical protein